MVLVGSGGFIGAVLRYAVGTLAQGSGPSTAFPWATVVVNLLGCLLIGLLAGAIEVRQLFTPEVRLFALIGVLGGFTTFSTFGFETFSLLRDANYLGAFVYVGLQVFLGLALVWTGYSLVSRLS